MDLKQKLAEQENINKWLINKLQKIQDIASSQGYDKFVTNKVKIFKISNELKEVFDPKQ